MEKFVKKVYEVMLNLNCYFLVLAAICMAVGSKAGSPLFIYTSVVGLIDAISNKSKNGIIVNSTFAAMNTYFTIVNFIS